MRSIRIADVYMAAAVAAVATTLSGPVYAESAVLTDNAGMTVYTFDQDSAGTSACYGDCAAAWPPVTADNMPADPELGVISRDDGTKQAAHKDKPLYLFVGDRRPGDVNGDNVQNVWHVVRKSGATAVPQSKPATSSYGSSYGDSYSY